MRHVCGRNAQNLPGRGFRPGRNGPVRSGAEQRQPPGTFPGLERPGRPPPGRRPPAVPCFHRPVPGGLDGVGLGNSAEKHGTLPFAHTDFIFAPLGEEFGFYGTMFVLLCYFLMTYAGIGVAMQCRDTYGRFLAVGIVAIIFCPAILNIAVVTNAVPNSGLPLPFISFGGTNLVFTLAALGMLTSIQRFSTGAQPNCEITRKDERSIDVRL
ncbi:hypothetical protein CUC01_03640 [Akkermansia muciniphila]|nr:hypothetical protein CUB96_00445 [Akkermansia muciniphila]AYR32274.1 hypothetical protein CUC01_03640 [Akkermansia muciniphila]